MSTLEQSTRRAAPPVAPHPLPPVPRPTERRHVPRSWRRRAADLATTWLNRGLNRLPGSGFLHRRCLRAIDLSRIEVTLERGQTGLTGLSIAYLVDVHAGSFTTEDDLCRLFERVARQEPDVVCLGGDLINSRASEILALHKPLTLLEPPGGVYAVPGNHDHYWGEDLGSWCAVLEEAGAHVLLNRGVRIERQGASLWLAGVDDLSDGLPDLDRALAGRRDGEPVVLLAHQPDHFAEAAEAGVDLTLSGHTHGGQIRIGDFVPLVHSRFGYCAGMYEHGPSRLYVSRGVGATVLPIRIGARAELPLFELRVDGVEG